MKVQLLSGVTTCGTNGAGLGTGSCFQEKGSQSLWGKWRPEFKVRACCQCQGGTQGSARRTDPAKDWNESQACLALDQGWFEGSQS